MQSALRMVALANVLGRKRISVGEVFGMIYHDNSSEYSDEDFSLLERSRERARRIRKGLNGNGHG